MINVLVFLQVLLKPDKIEAVLHHFLPCGQVKIYAQTFEYLLFYEVLLFGKFVTILCENYPEQ